MSKNENWMDPFRTQSRENVYVLGVRIIEEGKEVKNIKEVVDCPKGEAGVRYVNNLLCRLANEALRGTEIEKSLWREYHRSCRESDKDYTYTKAKDMENYVIAEMKWHQQLPER